MYANVLTLFCIAVHCILFHCIALHCTSKDCFVLSCLRRWSDNKPAFGQHLELPYIALHFIAMYCRMLILETSAYMPSMSLTTGILPHTSWLNLLRVIPSYKSASSTISAVIIDNQDVYAGNHLCPWYHPTTNLKIKIILTFSHSTPVLTPYHGLCDALSLLLDA